MEKYVKYQCKFYGIDLMERDWSFSIRDWKCSGQMNFCMILLNWAITRDVI